MNNDGDLFTYGEAICGFLPYVNERLEAAGSAKQYKNLFGITLGTGFGAGIARNGELFIGDNAAAAEIWVSRGKLHNRCFVEEDVSIRAVQRVYAEHSKVKHAETPTPKDIYDFATGSGKGDRQAAIAAFSTLGEAIGDALANAMTLIDGLVVIGGGLSAAAPLFMPRLVAEMNGTIETLDGRQIPRMELKAFNLEDQSAFDAFARGEARRITVPGSSRQLTYDPLKRIGVGLSRLGTSEAVAVGAYAFALHELDHQTRRRCIFVQHNYRRFINELEHQRYFLAVCAILAVQLGGLVCLGGESTPFESVRPMVGTAEHGHTYPGATVPFGMVQLSPDTRLESWDGCSAYHYSDSAILGFSHTHLSGTGCSDLGDIRFCPLSGKIPKMEKDGYHCKFSHKDEVARPGYYAVTLQDPKIGVELTATPHAGFHKYVFPAGDVARLFLDLGRGCQDQPIESVVKVREQHRGYRLSPQPGLVVRPYVLLRRRVFAAVRRLDGRRGRQAAQPKARARASTCRPVSISTMPASRCS